MTAFIVLFKEELTMKYNNRALIQCVLKSYCYAKKQDKTGLMASGILHGAYQSVSGIYGIFSSDAVFLSELTKRNNRIDF